MKTPALHPDFRAFIESLRRHGVRFPVVGAHAMAYHGRPRDTDDLDVLVAPTVDNARTLASALRYFGGYDAVADMAETHLAVPDRIVTLGRPPVAIDVITSISGLGFDEAFANRVEGEVDRLVIPFISLDDFVRNKKASGRTKDLQDLVLLAEGGVISEEDAK